MCKMRRGTSRQKNIPTCRGVSAPGTASSRWSWSCRNGKVGQDWTNTQGRANSQPVGHRHAAETARVASPTHGVTTRSEGAEHVMDGSRSNLPGAQGMRTPSPTSSPNADPLGARTRQEAHLLERGHNSNCRPESGGMSGCGLVGCFASFYHLHREAQYLDGSTRSAQKADLRPRLDIRHFTSDQGAHLTHCNRISPGIFWRGKTQTSVSGKPPRT